MTHNGATYVSYKSRTKFKKLATWMMYQRRMYSKGKLSQERIDVLESLGFQWVQHNQQDCWMEMYDRLVAYKTKHGTLRVPFRLKDDPKLGWWVSCQRFKCEDPDQIKLLNDIGFVWKKQKK